MAVYCCRLRPEELDGETEGGRQDAESSTVQPLILKFLYLPMKGW